LPFMFYFIGYFFRPCTYELFSYVISCFFSLFISSCCFFMYISINAIFYYGIVQVKHPYFFTSLYLLIDHKDTSLVCLSVCLSMHRTV
jgi:hypothetical protein